MSAISDLETLHTAYAQTWSGVARISALFVLGGIVFYAFFERSRGGPSFRKIWNYLFPTELYRHSSARVDKWNCFLHLLLWGPAGAVIGVVLGAHLGINVQSALVETFGPREPLLHGVATIVAVQVVYLYVTWEFTDFSMHFAWHRIPLLWNFHRAHHSTEALTLFATFRAHPLEYFAVRLQEIGHLALFGGVLVYLTGTPLHPHTLPTYLMVRTVLGLGNVLTHAHIPVSFGKLNRVIGSSVLHQIHHSAEPQHRDKNFGLNLMIFDWLFGTLYLPKPGETYRWGLNEEEIGPRNPHARLRDLYLEPLQRLLGLLGLRRGA
jgi:sterol desaturase/sphingolipid hydroxylase (fatty acid hydroxylase superfamily)